MKNVNYISVNERNLFNDVINEKQLARRAILLNIQARINGYYNTYLTNFAALQIQKKSKIIRSEASEKEALVHCFDTPTGSFKPIRGKIKLAQSNLFKIICPYCLLNEWDTLDHYLPKASFPEYSILVKNLVPCCTQCNKLKDEDWRKGNQRQIIHFYNDNFLNHKFLFASIIVKRNSKLPVIQFYIQKPPAISNYQFSIIRYHFKKLNLLNRYTDLANTSISTHVETIESNIRNGINTLLALQTTLMDSYRATSSSYTINYYEAIIFEAFASNTRYLNSLCKSSAKTGLKIS